MAALQKMDWARLNEAGNAVVAAMNPPAGPTDGPIPPRGSAPRVGWGPTVDGRIVTMRAFFEGAPEISKNGNPSAAGLPWAAFSPDRCPTMVFDNDCRMVDDPDAEARKLLLT